MAVSSDSHGDRRDPARAVGAAVGMGGLVQSGLGAADPDPEVSVGIRTRATIEGQGIHPRRAPEGVITVAPPEIASDCAFFSTVA